MPRLPLLVATGALTGLLASCTAPECAPERLPYGGRVQTTEELFRLVQYASRSDCCETLYGNLTRATRDEHGEWKFCAFWDAFSLPEPYEAYDLGDVVREGAFVGTFPSEREEEEFLLVEYDRDGPVGPQPNLLAKILVRFEMPEAGGLPEPKIGLQEQVQAIEGGRPGYYWDASR